MSGTGGSYCTKDENELFVLMLISPTAISRLQTQEEFPQKRGPQTGPHIQQIPIKRLKQP